MIWYDNRAGKPLAHVPKIAHRKISLARGIHCSPIFLLFLLPIQHLNILKKCVYIHIPGCVETVYELLVLPNNTARETFLHKLGAVWSVDWIFIIGALVWQWLGESVPLDRMFYNLLFKQKVVRTPVTSIFSSFFSFLEEAYSRNII